MALATSLGAGFCPIAPGTAGAAAGLLIWWVATLLLPFATVQTGAVAASIFFTLLSLKPINRLEQQWGKDPSRVVIDETVGVWLALFAVPQADAWYHIAAAFVLFRLLDMTKPFGIRRLERLHGGVGVMMDDIAAGLLAATLLALFSLLIG